MAVGNQYRLASCLKHYTVDQDKTVAPTETVARALAKLRGRFDLSNVRIERRQDAIEGAYSFSSLSDQLMASGKGLTPEQSQASAIMEFAERYSWLHFNYQAYDGYAVKTYEEVCREGVPTVPPEYFLANFIELSNRAQLQAEIATKLPLKWITGQTLPDYRPFRYPLNWHNYVWTSNGLATGNAMEEAIIQGLSEVIERENVFRFFGDRQPGNDLDQSSIKNEKLRVVLANGTRAGIRFVIKDISPGLGIPTFLAHGICEADKDKLTYLGCGYGTHPNPEKALIRALTEYFEGYSLMKKADREVPLDWRMIIARLPKNNFGFLPLFNPEMLQPSSRVVKLGDIPDLSQPDIKQEIERYLAILAQHKYQVILLDKSNAELGIPVVRLVVPGMRNCIVNEFRDPLMAMAESYYEAGDELTAAKYLYRSNAKKAYFLPPEMRLESRPSKCFKEDYRATLLSQGNFKKDSLSVLQQSAAALRNYRPYA